MLSWDNCKNLEDFEICRVIESLLIKHSTLGQQRESVASTNISKSPKMQENTIFFQEIDDFLKIIRETIFF